MNHNNLIIETAIKTISLATIILNIDRNSTLSLMLKKKMAVYNTIDMKVNFNKSITGINT
jgi:hypothetical protein